MLLQIIKDHSLWSSNDNSGRSLGQQLFMILKILYRNIYSFDSVLTYQIHPVYEDVQSFENNI